MTELKKYINNNLFDEEKKTYVLSFTAPFALNGILLSLDAKNNRLFLFNATQNVIYLQKGTKVGEVKI